jgi:hypothetical protein
LYVTGFLSDPYGQTLILKYSLSTFSSTPVDTLLLDTAYSFGHAMRCKDGIIYVTGSTSPPWIASIRASDLAGIQFKKFPGGKSATDDFGLSKDYAFVGVESDFSDSYSGAIFRVSLSDVTQIFTLKTGAKLGGSGECFGVQEAWEYIWAVFKTSPGTITRIDPVSMQFKNYRLEYNIPNEIVTDGKRLFITYWDQNPGVIQAFDPSYLEGREIP